MDPAAAPETRWPHTFREAAKAWLDDAHARAHSWAPETYAFNRGLLAEPGDALRRGRILRGFGDERVDQISVDDVREDLGSLDGKVAPEPSTRTVKYRRASSPTR